jgi:hypothetical protein
MKNLSELDALFALPLADFTAARNALAAKLKKEGRGEEAQQVKALTKPSATAWAVNQLYWKHRRDFDRLLTLNEKVRSAQIARADDLRSLLDERRKMISALATMAAELLSEAGHAASIDARRRVVTTLESLVARDRSNIELQVGRLTADLDPLGFDSIAELLGAPPEKAKVLDFQQGSKEKQAREKQNAEAERAARARAEALKQAEADLASARREAARAEAAAAKAVARREALEHEKQQLEARLAAAVQEARAASDEVRKSSREVAEAERALAKARDNK